MRGINKFYAMFYDSIKNFDTIKLNDNDIVTIGKYSDGQRRTRVKKYLDGELNFFINQGVLDHSTKVAFLYINKTIQFTVNVDDVLVSLGIDKECFCSSETDFDLKLIGIVDKERGLLPFQDIEGSMKDYLGCVIELSIDILLFFSEYKHTEIVKSRSTRGHNKGINKKKRNNSVVRLTKKIYEIDQNSEIAININKKQYIRQIESWTVRGHWRTLKSGKEIWIKSYVKGQGEIIPKTYKI